MSAPDIAVGQLIVFETGEYSDRSWIGPLRALKPFKQSEVAAAYVASCPPRGDEDIWDWQERGGPTPDGFLAWLTRQGYVEDIEPRPVCWHIGSYGEFEP
jgi:hypothetical protein